MPNDRLTASYAHEGIGLSLLLPDDWRAEELDPTGVRFHGPSRTLDAGHHPTMSVRVGEPGGHGPEWFNRFCEQALARLKDRYAGFALRSHERVALSSLVPVDATWYEWDASPTLRTAQLQALIPVDMSRLVLINAATRHEDADADLPVIDAIVRSIRVLPRR
jgi:hypothetical protein